MTSPISVGLVGIGAMGRGLARNIIRAGFPLTVLDPNPAALDDAVALGASAAHSLAELVEQRQVVLTCLSSMGAIHSIYDGPEGLVQLAAPGTVLVDCSTGDPTLSRELATRARSRGLDYLDAPMLRTAAAAWNGTQQMIVGGERATLARASAVLESFTERILHVGPVGAGHAMKLINNTVTICNTAVLCEAFVVARNQGVDLGILTEVLDTSMGASKVLPSVSKRLINDDHSPQFAVDVVKRYLSLYGQLAADADVTTPIGDTVYNLIRQVSNLGYGSEHYTRLASMLAVTRPLL